MSQERRGATDGQQIGSNVPAASSYCQVGCRDEEDGGDDEVSDCTLVLD